MGVWPLMTWENMHFGTARIAGKENGYVPLGLSTRLAGADLGASSPDRGARTRQSRTLTFLGAPLLLGMSPKPYLGRRIFADVIAKTRRGR